MQKAPIILSVVFDKQLGVEVTEPMLSILMLADRSPLAFGSCHLNSVNIITITHMVFKDESTYVHQTLKLIVSMSRRQNTDSREIQTISFSGNFLRWWMVDGTWCFCIVTECAFPANRNIHDHCNCVSVYKFDFILT